MELDHRQRLSWHQSDIEQKIGFRGGRFTRTNGWFGLFFGILLTVVFYLALSPFESNFIAEKFTKRGVIPYFISLFSFIAIVIVFTKSMKLKLQKKVLFFRIVPQDHNFVLSVVTAEELLNSMYEFVDDIKKFVLFNRINIALSNLKNLGRVTDVDEILRSQSEADESVMETSYSLLRGLIWAIPVLGFIGTVLGLSQAIGNFGTVLENSENISEITGSLKSVTGGLSTAFDTTLTALVAALGIQCLVTVLKKNEEEFLDDCIDYCQNNIVQKLRMMPYQNEVSDGPEN